MFALLNKYNPTIFYGVPTLFAAMLNDDDAEERARRRAAAHLHLRRRGAAGIGRQCLEGALRRRHSRRRRLDRTAAHLPVQRARRHQIRLLRPSGARLQGAAGQRSRRRCARWRSRRIAGRCALGRRGLLEPAQQEPSDLRGPLDPHRRQIHPRRRRPLHLLRPQRRHVQGLRHLGVAVRGRERADHPSGGAGGRRRARSRSGRIVEAEGLRGAARRQPRPTDCTRR